MSDSVSDLSYEIITQFKQFSSKPISLEDYLNIRSQAVCELNAGYKPRDQQIVTSEHKSRDQQTEVKSCNANAVVAVAKNTDHTSAKITDTDPFFALCDSVD